MKSYNNLNTYISLMCLISLLSFVKQQKQPPASALLFNNCNIAQSKLSYLFINQYETKLKPQLTGNMALSQLLSLISEFEKFNSGIYGNFKCDICTKTFIKKDYALLHKLLFHGGLNKQLQIQKQSICLGDYCNIYHCNKILQYTKLQPKFNHQADDFASYSSLNQREKFCDERLIANYRQMCLIHLRNNKNRFTYCSKLSCSKGFTLPSNTLDLGFQFLKSIFGILVIVLVFIYLAVIWLNRFF